ncbi:MAG: hypothetical protein KDC49_05610 [Saprospiraceae bacterium]|nr:hypothetical protein [Saprospiraceae bacterium]
MGEVIARKKIYNNIFEISIRILISLNTIERKKLAIDELLIYDHLILNTFDVDGPASLHAPIPNRGVQLYSKKEIFQQSLAYLISKDLCILNSDKKGILYSINSNGSALLLYLESEYFTRLCEKAKWVNKNFGQLNRSELNQFVRENITNWGTEFMAKDNYNEFV